MFSRVRLEESPPRNHHRHHFAHSVNRNARKIEVFLQVLDWRQHSKRQAQEEGVLLVQVQVGDIPQHPEQAQLPEATIVTRCQSGDPQEQQE